MRRESALCCDWGHSSSWELGAGSWELGAGSWELGEKQVVVEGESGPLPVK